VGLALVGVGAALGAVVFPDGREVLFALAAVGLFGGVLTYYLTPGTFVAADVGERIYAAMAANEPLSPVSSASATTASTSRPVSPSMRACTSPAINRRVARTRRARRAVPDRSRSPRTLPRADRRDAVRGFERALTAELATAPAPLATQLADGLVEQFELAASADPDVDVQSGRVTVAITASAFGAVDRFDHPIASFLAVGFVTGLDRPIRLEVTPGDERSDWLVTCRWNDDNDDEASVGTEAAIREETAHDGDGGGDVQTEPGAA